MGEKICFEVRDIPVVIDSRAVQDRRFLKIISELADDNIDDGRKVLLLNDMGERLFGHEQYENICATLEDDEGYQDAAIIDAFIGEAFTELSNQLGTDSKN